MELNLRSCKLTTQHGKAVCCMLQNYVNFLCSRQGNEYFPYVMDTGLRFCRKRILVIFLLRAPKDDFGMINHFVEGLETISAVTVTAVTENASLHKMCWVQRERKPTLCLRHCCCTSAALHVWYKKYGNMTLLIRNSAGPSGHAV